MLLPIIRGTYDNTITHTVLDTYQNLPANGALTFQLLARFWRWVFPSTSRFGTTHSSLSWTPFDWRICDFDATDRNQERRASEHRVDKRDNPHADRTAGYGFRRSTD